ncbi:hypothetical protein RUND412_004201 [Rhizina undulata]
MPYRYQQLDNPDSDDQRCFVTLISLNFGPEIVAHLECLNGFCPQLVYQLNNPPSSMGNSTKLRQFATALTTLPNAVTSNSPQQLPAITPFQQQCRPQFLLYLTEVWSKSRMAYFTVFWLMSNLGINVGYSIIRDDIQTAFGIGAYFLAWGPTLVIALQIAISVS